MFSPALDINVANAMWYLILDTVATEYYTLFCISTRVHPYIIRERWTKKKCNKKSLGQEWLGVDKLMRIINIKGCSRKNLLFHKIKYCICSTPNCEDFSPHAVRTSFSKNAAPFTEKRDGFLWYIHYCFC